MALSPFLPFRKIYNELYLSKLLFYFVSYQGFTMPNKKPAIVDDQVSPMPGTSQFIIMPNNFVLNFCLKIEPIH